MFDDVSMHGLSRVTNSSVNWPRRIFWSVILLTGLGFSCYNIALQSMHYSQTPVNVLIDVKANKTLSLPVITICNYNSVTRSTINRVGIRKLIERSLPFWFDFNQSEPDYSQYNFTAVDESVWSSFYDKHTPSIEDIILQVLVLCCRSDVYI